MTDYRLDSFAAVPADHDGLCDLCRRDKPLTTTMVCAWTGRGYGVEDKELCEECRDEMEQTEEEDE